MNAIPNKKLDLVVLNNIPAEACGAIVLWRLQGGADFNRLMQELTDRGVTDKVFLPDLPSPEVALRRAVQDQQEARLLMRSLPQRAGYALVRERTTTDESQPLQYEVVMQVKRTPDGNAYEGEASLIEKTQAAYNAGLLTLDSNDVANWLCDCARRLLAVALRDTGGVYFIPRNTLVMWQALTGALKASSATVCSEIPALTSDEAVAAILDAVTRESELAITGMQEDLANVVGTNGVDSGIGSRAVKTRQAKAEQLNAKLTAYEGLLGKSLDEVRTKVDGLRAALGAAYLVAAAFEGKES